MTSDDQNSDRNDNTVAAEYVLGVLNAAERHNVQNRLATDPALRAEVAHWEMRLAPLMSEIAEIEPPPHVWERIVSQTNGRQGEGEPQRRWPGLIFWKSMALGSASLAAICLVALVYVLAFKPRQGPLLADVVGAQSKFVAALDPGSRALTVIPAAAVGQTGEHALQLWLIVGDHKPQSLGLIEAAKPARIVLPAGLTLLPGATLAVSLEPPGGSPTGQPTGPVIASGKITNL